MNRIFRILWSKALRAWVVASELATPGGKSGRTVDRRVTAVNVAQVQDALEDSPPAQPWPLRLSIFMALMALYAPAQAADRYWDSNNTAVGFGGIGTWDTSGAFWSPNSDGVSGPYSAWNNAALDDAFFSGTPTGTVTLGVPITVHNLTLGGGYTLTGSTLTLGGVAPSITVSAGAATIASPITSTSGLIKAGAGNLTLDGSNSFGGGIDVNGGTLTLNAANSFTGTINATGGNLAIGAIGDAALGGAGNLINLGNGRSISTGGTISTSRTVNLVSGIGVIRGSGLGGVFYTGAGGLNVGDGIALTNNANNYQGLTQFVVQPNWGGSSNSFSSIADLGVASALGAPTTVANGTIRIGPGGGQSLGANNVYYTGTGNSSNRNWLFTPGSYAGAAYLHNAGSGTLRLTGNISGGGDASHAFGFSANSADMELMGVISGGNPVVFNAGSGRTIRLGTANTFSGQANINGAGTVEASLLANAGVAGSLGTGSIFINGGNLSYLGAGESTNKNWSIANSGALNSNGTGALSLSGTVAIGGGTANLGGSFNGADNVISGVISGAGNLRSAGNTTWTLLGANTYTGSTIVDSGVLRAGTASAFGGSTVAQVNGGTLDLNDFDKTFSTLTGTGGTVDLGTANLTLQAAAGTTATYAGSITGSGGLTKLGASTQTLTGASTYTGATTIGGGTLNLDFRPAGGPTSSIIAGASTFNMGGGVLNVLGAAGESNTQTFNGLNITGSNNTISATSGSGGNVTVNLGAITRTGGLMNFNLPGSGNITTTNTLLGGWATVNGTNYAKVVGGNILAFTAADYVNKDDASTWLNNEIISDAGGALNTAYFSTVSGSKQIGGLQYTAAANSTITVAAGQTLGVDGTIIVAPTVGAFNQTIAGPTGSLTGTLGGGVLGIQQNGTGTFTIASQIVDNGGVIGFTKAGTGFVSLTNATSNYTGATTVSQGTLSVISIANGGAASSIGASSAASSNLVLEGSTLRYTGGTTNSDRGFTIAKSGAILGSTIDVTTAAANLTFGGLVTSSDGAGLTKSGAGTLTLANDSNDYTGVTTVTGGLLSVDTLANGGQVSGIGAASAASANLVLDGGGLQYTGATTSTNRGFTLGANNGTVDVSNAATTLTVSGTVVQQAGGNRTLTKNGAGTLVLSGTNTYTGGNTVNAGILRAGSTQAFGALSGAGVMTLANAAGVTLDLNNFNNSIGPLNGGGANGGNVTLGSATLRIAGGNGNYSGAISGTGGVWRTDGGNQTFNGCNNTYTGVTNLQGATLTVNCLADGGAASGIGASSNASTNLVFNSGNLNYTGGTVSIDRGFNLASGYGVIDVINGTTLGFSGQVVGGAELYKDNAGTLVLSGNNTYTNNTHVRGGTLRAGSNTAFGTTNSFWMDNTAGALLDLNNFNANAGGLIGGGAAGGNIALGTGTLTIRDGFGQAYAYAGAISGTGNLVKNGGGTQVLTGCNSSYTGTTTINAGVLQVNCLENGGVNSAIGASSAAPANLVLNGGSLRYIGAGGSTDHQFTLGTSGGTLDASGTGIIEFASTAPVTLAGANTARTLTLTGTNTGYNLLAAQLDNNGAGVTSLTKTGTGTWRLTNNNSTYTGVTRINGGVLSVDQMANGGLASSIGASTNAATNLVIGNGSTLRYTGAGDTTDRQFTLDTGVTFIESSGTGALQFTNTGAVTLTGTNTARTIALGGTNTGNNIMGGAIGNNGTGATTLAKNDSGTWVLTGNNTYSGNTVINNGNLVIGNGGTTGNAGVGNVIVDSPTSTLSLNRSDTFTFAGTLSGPGTLAQIGTGTSVLTSASNSIGATTISAGTLQVNGALATPTVAMTGPSALSVNGTVQASGGTQTALTGDAGAQTITVGTGGTLLASGNLGGGNDIVNLTGTLNTGTGALQLGDGDDTLVLNDGAQMLGNGVATSGGTGTDTLVVNTALGYTLDGGSIDTFDILAKQNTGPLTLTGDHDFAVGTNLNGGLLDVDGSLETPTLTMADGTTLNVDGNVEDAGSTPATITGSAGTNTITVGITGTLRADGDLGDGSDAVTLAGLLSTGAGTLGLGAGNDVLTLQDGSFIEGGGVNAGAGGNDQLVLDNALAMVFDGGQTAGFETLLKQNAGTATMTGSQSFNFGTTISAGALDVNGALETPTIALADNTALIVDGSVSGGAGGTALISGSAGVNTVAVGADGTLLANGDLGTGNDVLDIAGTLNTGAGIFALGDGDDTLTIHENTNIVGTVSAGAGNDTFDTHIDTVANLGAVQGFETLSKTGAGVLNINGPLSSDFTAVTVAAGTLNVTAAGSVVPAPGNTLATTVASGATLNVDGSYGCGAGSDTMTVAGTVSGTGTIDLCGGDDTLTLQDGVVLTNAISGGLGTSDRLVLDSAGALTFDAGNTVAFELLQKSNAGTATLTGSQSFTGGTTITGGTLDVDGALETPTVFLAGGTTLNVDGALQAAGGTAAIVTGDTGANTVSVGAGGTLVAVGDLGAGSDTLDVTGTFDTDGGVFALGDGDDNFVVHDGTVVIGTIDGGAGLDTRTYNINTTADLGALVNFEGVTKTGTGVLNVTGPGVTNVQDVQVLGGTLDIGVAGSLDGVQNATVASGTSLVADGSMLFTPGADIFTVAGNVSGSGTIDMLDGNDNLILQDGADLTGLVTSIDGGTGTDTLTADIAATATLGGVSNFETLSKTNTGTLIVAGPAPSGFTTVNVDGGTLDVGVAGSISGVVTTTVAGGTTLDVDGAYSGSAGNDTMTVAGTISGAGTIFFDSGDDVLTLNDGADLSGFAGTLDGGAHSGGDTVVLNNAADLTFGAGTITNFEFLAKTNTGRATLTGTQSYSGGTTLAGGELVIGGTLATPTLAMGDDTTLDVDGTLDAGAATATVITGSGGINTVSINGTARITGDLGGGEDVLDVFGTLDTLGGAFALGDGDDTFAVHDGTVVLGTVDGGAGLDTRIYDINLTADVGTLVNFEGITKTGTGVLNITGAGTTSLQEVSVLGGTLNIGPAGSVTAIAGGPLNTVIANGATLRVDGSYGCGDSDDTMTVAGTVSGTGTIDLCGGEDVLTLHDGAVLANVISGGSHGSGDTVVLNTAAAFIFDATNTINFEYLQKDNAGEATLVGTQSFTGGTTVNGGTLTVAGQLQTPTMALADNTVLNVDGRLDATGGTAVAITGSTGVNTVTVGAGGSLLATGDLGDGNDLLDVAGALDTAGGAFVLGNGDDTLTIHDNTNIIGTVVAGEGNDTFNADIAAAANLGAVQDFETLSKTSGGVLNVNGPASSDFTTVNVLGGTLNVTSGGSITAQTTTVADGAVLDVQGSYAGTDGDDSFISRGTVRGAFAFGTGNDTVAFIGGNPSGVTSLNGGVGNDRLSFSGLELESENLPTLTSWERVELLNNSALNLANQLDLGGGVLAIDGTSQLLAGVGAAIGGSVENAGLIDVGMNRLAISGNYASNDGSLRLTVSPSSLTAGGLNINGDVVGTTRVAFAGDGSDFTQGGEASILVISSPNDNAATAGGFVAAQDIIRLEGSIYPWSFGQQADNNWYLNAEAGVLPEVPAYGVLPSLGLLAAQNSDNLIHQRLAGVRGNESPQCGVTPEWPVQRAGTEVIDDCRGVWVAATGSETELGANPGFEVSGDDVGLYVGVDSAFDRPGRTLRGGVYLGYRHGNYWTTGVNSTDLPGTGAARVQIDTLVAGMYMSHTWDAGSYLNFVLTGHLPRADIRTSDGFSEHIPGNSVTFSSRVGHRYRLQNNWTLEPQAQLTVSAVGWGSKIDQSGKEVAFDDDLVTTARTALRIEKEITRDNGAVIRPWATLGVQKITGQNETSVSLMTPGDAGDMQAFPNHQLGTSATLEVGLEATLNQRTSLFGVLSVGKQLDGTDYEQREANLGVRVRW